MIINAMPSDATTVADLRSSSQPQGYSGHFWAYKRTLATGHVKL